MKIKSLVVSVVLFMVLILCIGCSEPEAEDPLKGTWTSSDGLDTVTFSDGRFNHMYSRVIGNGVFNYQQSGSYNKLIPNNYTLEVNDLYRNGYRMEITSDHYSARLEGGKLYAFSKWFIKQ